MFPMFNLYARIRGPLREMNSEHMNNDGVDSINVGEASLEPNPFNHSRRIKVL